MNLFQKLFSTKREARRRVDEFRTGRTYRLQGDVSALNLLSDLRIYSDNILLGAGSHPFFDTADHDKLKLLDTINHKIALVFNGCPDTLSAYLRIGNMMSAGDITREQYEVLFDAAQHYYTGTMAGSILFKNALAQMEANNGTGILNAVYGERSSDG